MTICIAIGAFLLALGMTLYPIISTIYNEKHQSQIHTQYQEQVEQVDDSAIRKAKELAIAYNEAIQPGAQMSDAFSNDALLWASEDYKNQLNIAGTGIMGYVNIPSINVHLPIYHGTETKTLEKGIGHLLGSSLPVGGDTTHSILTAHSGMASQKMFSDLPQLKIGDVFYLEVLGETLAYQVDQIKTVLPYDVTYLGIEEGRDLCTLVTCTPFGVNTHRLLVRGTRIPYEEAEEIIEETLSKRPNYEILCISRLLYLLSLIQRASAETNNTGNKGWNGIARAVQHMNRYCDQNLKLEDYASMCHMSKYHFLRVFKEVTGTTPLEYRNRIRIDHAKEMLKNSNSSVSEISEALGYSSLAYFSAVFKKATGTSPTEYRTE